MPLDNQPTSEPERSKPTILDYQSPPESRPMTRVFPLGLISATLGICAAGGVPVFDAITKVPGFVQGPIMLTGVVTGVLAVGSGIGAVFVPQERTRGIIGIILGAAAIIMLPSLMRA